MSVTLNTRREGLYSRLKQATAESIVSQALNLLSHASEKNYRQLALTFDRIADGHQQKMIAEWLKGYLAEDRPGATFLSRILKNVHPNVRKKFLAKMIVGLFFRRDDPDIARFKTEYGIQRLTVIVFSPTMRCNLKCTGCYAGNYTKADDLPPEVMERVINEAKALGVRFFVISGGEPFIYEPLLDLFEKHNDVAFQVYTNGTLIDEQLADRLLALGNVSPAISIEGFKDLTDMRRGEGIYELVLRAMDNLRERGVIFSFSATATAHNIEVITSDEFIDLMIGKGATYGWYFSYIPIGRSPDLNYMPTPAQRNQLRAAVNRIRTTKPIMVADFWNDGALTGGCISAGRCYLHINNRGDIEPCVFCHFATHNIKETTLMEALASPFFVGLRSLQPFNHNHLRPCPLIDNPKAMRFAVQKWGAYPTHPGAESLVRELSDGLDKYSAGLERVYNPVWHEKYNWAEDWLDPDLKDKSKGFREELIAPTDVAAS
ncbi:MAG: radical SAM protein [Chloroflexi bacterium]|nr:radical SAM protein [Chloroflexota bacterium]